MDASYLLKFTTVLKELANLYNQLNLEYSVEKHKLLSKILKDIQKMDKSLYSKNPKSEKMENIDKLFDKLCGSENNKNGDLYHYIKEIK